MPGYSHSWVLSWAQENLVTEVLDEAQYSHSRPAHASAPRNGAHSSCCLTQWEVLPYLLYFVYGFLGFLLPR